MSRRPTRNLVHPVLPVSTTVEEWMSTIGPPDFSASRIAPRGMDVWLDKAARDAMQSPSVETLKRITSLIPMNEYVAAYPQLFRPFFHQLQSAPPTRCLTEADRQKTRIGLVCFHGVQMVYEHLQRTLLYFRRPETSVVIRTLTDSWPNIWKWMQYLYKIDPKAFSFLDDIMTVTTMRHTFLRVLGRVVCGVPTPFGDAIETTPGVFAMMVDIWEKASQVEVIDEDSCLDSTLATVAIQASIKFDPTRVQTLIDVMDGDIDRVATLVMRNLRMTFDTNGKRAAINEFQLSLLFSTWVADLLPGLHHALLSQNSMILVTRTLGKVSTMRGKPTRAVQKSHSSGPPWATGEITPPNDYDSDVDPATKYSLEYFEAASRTSGGFTWIIQAIRSGMILALLRSACRDSEEIDHPLVIKCIAEIIRPYLVYRSVLRAVSKALRDPIIRTIESKLSRNREFLEAWIEFRQLVAVRLAAKEKFDSGGEHGQRCSSARCNKIEGNESFRLCSNCQEASYCSPECQKYDWKHEGHRKACASLRKDRADGVAAPIPSRDLAFFHFIADNDIMEHRHKILRLRDEKFTGDATAHPDSFIISLDPSSHPSEFRIFTHDHKPEISLYKSTRQFNDTPSAALGAPSPADVIDIHITVPYGEEYIIIPYSSDMASSLFGWDSQLQLETPTEYLDNKPFTTG